MQLVIEISDKFYKNILNNTYDYGDMNVIIQNGTPLPKGHGRLIDADAYRKELRIEIPNLDYDGSLEPYEEGIYSTIMSLDDTPTIIEAEESESE